MNGLYLATSPGTGTGPNTGLVTGLATGLDRGMDPGTEPGMSPGMGMDMGMMQPGALLPEIFLLAGVVICLLGGSFLSRQRQWVARVVALVALAGAAIGAVVDLTGETQDPFDGTFTVDSLTGAARLIVVVATALVILLGTDELSGDARESETYTLILLGALGTIVLAGANDLLIVITGYLLASIPLYGLIGLARTRPSAEAAMKTYLMGALLGIGLMLGVVVFYGLANTTGYDQLPDQLASAPTAAVAFATLAVIGGLMFKAGGVPGHFWVPDATQGSSTATAAFLTTVPKIGAVIATYRLVTLLPDDLDWPLLIAILAAASMTLGNLAAFGQDDPKRLLGWSTVSQVGYALVPVAVAGRTDLAAPSMLVFLAAYAVTNATAFAVVAAHPTYQRLSDYRGLITTSPLTAIALVIALLGLVGTPPTAIFVGKLTTASAAWDGGIAWLAVAVMVNSVASLFYYLRWIAPSFTRAVPASQDRAHEATPTATPDDATSDDAAPGDATPRSGGDSSTSTLAHHPDPRGSEHDAPSGYSAEDMHDHAAHTPQPGSHSVIAPESTPSAHGGEVGLAPTSTPPSTPTSAPMSAPMSSASLRVAMVLGAASSLAVGVLAGPLWEAFTASVPGP